MQEFYKETDKCPEDISMIDEKNETSKEKSEFEKKYRYGSTTVFFNDGHYRFYGDIEHCGKKAIFHNALTIKNDMKKNNTKYAHMSYNDPPKFDKVYKHEKIKDEIEKYRHDVYQINNKDGIILIEEYWIENHNICEKCGSKIPTWRQNLCIDCENGGKE